jgi:hypothetical protein
MLLGTACGKTVPTGYFIYTLQQGVRHFSIEYPAHFNVTTVQLLEAEKYTMVDIYGPFMKKERVRTRIWVTVSQKESQPQDAITALDATLSIARTLPGYNMMERNTLNVNGIKAEQVEYFYYASRSDYEVNILKLEVAPTVAREVCFLYGGAIWTMSMTSYEATVEADKLYFEHLLETFKVLN